ncbi:hypothetical protein C923_00142 [Plasmodium falciparum UGT5.1]|uniref:Erythrocyte membrane protein 1 n=1 Tax=Plasmodium falciparum UGT5.1 TaxID=1237627 RepID=W7K575_PLAFA|nr:hypothetical protein C923_00142 [Plasmodium falciparum UGT5.1]
MVLQVDTTVNKYTLASDVKNLLDIIGEVVQKQAHDAALGRSYNDLHGLLTNATYPKDRNSEKTTPSDPCALQYQYHTNVTSTEINPCDKRSPDRFSDTKGAECDNNKIRGSDKKSNGGACAPFRRLSVCDTNLEQIKTENITTHNLLVDVCQAAKFEGQSIAGYYAQYDEQYPSSGSTICTVLARSFADIGDIVRGRDLYRRDKGKREKLESKLKQYFKNIYDNLNGAEARYDGDGPEFFKLREDWWNANRETVWKALTCDHRLGGSQYFRPTCGDDSGTLSHASNKCRCPKGDQVPTYFDYVPQFLRWFEEWAEDFCRKRKKKIENAIKNCRYDESGEPKYCDLNGFDCTKTARGRNKFAPDSNCNKCSVACKPFVEWLGNQKEEFEKQKEKYTKEINKTHGTTLQVGKTTINNLYVDDFYKILKKYYAQVKTFLEKLSKEGICQSNPNEKNETANSVNFSEHDVHDIFSSTKYCRACPLCGVTGEEGKWNDKNDTDCANKVTKKYNEQDTTTIPRLTPDKSQKNILQKYKSFCQNLHKKDEQIENWQCHYEKNDKDDGNGDINNCILGDWNNFTEEDKIMSYYSFFYGSIIDMLNDSIEWKDKLNSCINNKTGICRRLCKNPCECYKRWVERKKEEWDKIKKHFRKQKNIEELIGEEGDPDSFLELYLKITFLDDMTKAHADTKVIEKFTELLPKEYEDGVPNFSNEKRIIDEFLEKVLQEAENCVTNNPHEKCDKKPQKQPGAGGGVAGRSDPDPSPQSPAASTDSGGEESDSEESDSEEEEEDEKDTVDTAKDNTEGAVDGEKGESGPEEGLPPKVEVNPCQIVTNLFQNPNKFSDACTLKYVTGKNYGWKCVPTTSGGDNSTTKPGAHGKSGSGNDGATGKSGAICVPPRRRKLYVGKLEQWVDKQVETQASDVSQTQPQTSGTSSQGEAQTASEVSAQTAAQPPPDSAASPSNSRDDAALRDAFVKSAAVETFFLWDRYKKIKEKEKKEKKEANGELPGLSGSGDGGDQTPETSLKSGKIPPDFLRQMFYTLADYKDILYSGSNTSDSGSGSKDTSSSSNDNLKHIVLEASGNKEEKDKMRQIQEQLKKFFQNSGDKPSTGGKQTPSENPQTWWNKHAQHIWHGMIYALTYNTDSGGKEQAPIQDKQVERTLIKDGKPNPPNDYNSVKLDNSDTQAKTDNEQPPTLKQFTSRPTYFRYLEEWGQNFCKKRTEMLGKIKEECRSGKYGKEHCSGDGHYCKTSDLKHHKMFEDFVCRDCYEQCRKYRKWIDLKFEEFHKQENKYEGEHGKLKANHNGDKKFCEEIQQHTTADKFLAALKHCKNDQTSENKGNQEDQLNKLDFTNIPQTFSRSTYCKACPIYGVTCNGVGRSRIRGTSGCTEKDPNWKTVFDTINGNNEKITENINLEMIDRRGPFIEKYMKEKSEKSKDSNDLFKTSSLFKGIRKQNWTCKFNKDEDKDVCKLNKFKENIDLNEYTTFKVFLVYWLEDFLYGYYILKKKIELCTQKEKNTCTEDSKKNCACVKAWVEKKTTEWDQIKEHFNKQEHEKGYDIVYTVKSLLDNLIPLMDLVNDKAKVTKLSQLDYSCGCSADASAQKNDGHKDAIECLLNKLTEKIKTATCPNQTSSQTLDQSGENQKTPCQESPPVEEDEEDLLLEEENDKKVEPPTFCEIKDTTEQEEEGDKCEPAPTPKDTAAGGEGKQNPEPTPPLKPEEERPPGPEAPATPTQADEPFNRDILEKTIPFGDSGTDSGYTDHYSDITSSSESEYEELDINDIYVPHAPKYKTLIEVVLEPSGNNTTASGKNTTASGNNTTASGNNTTASGKNTPSDTQNDIQNDGIPSSKITDNEWNTLKDEFISQYLQSEQPKDVPNDYSSGTIPTNTNITTTSRHNVEEKPFITSIHDRDLYSGEEYSYNVNMVNNDIPMSGKNGTYTGIDLINDTLSGNEHIDIYDELLKRKENELFGTNHVKQTSIHSVAKPARDDPIHNQLELFHKWLDRHRDMCEKWENHHERLAKLKEEWENETHSGNTHPSDSNKTLNTDVSIQIHMDNPKPINEFSNMDTYPNNSSMDTILEDLEKYNEPYYDVQDDIYYDVHDHDTSTVDSNNMNIPSKVQIEMDINTKLVKEKYPIADVWDI